MTREEIQQLTWSDNTVVDFEVGINRCIRRIRTVLLDDADAPRYLETVPRIGYRFIAAVEPSAAESKQIGQLPAAVPVEAPLPVPRVRQSSSWMPFGIGVILLLAVAIAVTYWLATAREKQPKDLHVVPLAVSLGDQYTPTFSPDGRQVAFAWDGDTQDNFDIYLKLVNSSSPPLRLTTSKDVDYGPAWSPDGEWIAFCRGNDYGNGGIWVIPALGVAERKITDLDSPGAPWQRPLSWTPDSKRLILSAPVASGERLSLRSVDVTTGVKTILTRPAASDEDMQPAVSPDGQYVAFTRDVGRGISRILVVPIDGGTPTLIPVPSQNVYNARPAWTPDSKGILFVSNAGGENHVWLARFRSHSPPEELAALGDGIHDLTVSAIGQLGLVRQSEDSNLYVLDLPPAQHTAAPRRILASTRTEESPSIRPDGKQIAFASNRSGYEEIWTARIDGSDAMQVTYLQNPVTGSPDWSPNGSRIVFDSRASERPQLYLMSADGGKAQPVCCSTGVSTVPRWSRGDGRVYFSSDRTGRMEIWRVAPEGGNPVQVTKSGGFAPVPSPDGKSLYYASNNALVTSLWKQDLASGERKQIASPVLRRSYAPAFNGVYYFSGSTSEQRSSLYWLDEQSHRSTLLFTTDRRIGNGIALSPDGHKLYFTQLDVSNHQLLLAQNFWR